MQLEGMTSQREAAKQLGISRNTVKKYWEGDIVPWEHKPYTREASVMTPEVVQFVKECLDEDDAVGIKKQRHTARRIYHRLIDEYHFTGSESSVRNLVHDMRAARKISQVFIPLRFMPGDAAQIDWGEATVIMNGEKEKVNGKLIFDAYSQGDPTARAMVEEFLDYLGDGVASLVNIFQPEVFAIGGGLAGAGETILGPVRKILDQEDYARSSSRRTRLVKAKLGNDAGIIGAALLGKA